MGRERWASSSDISRESSRQTRRPETLMSEWRQPTRVKDNVASERVSSTVLPDSEFEGFLWFSGTNDP